MSRRTAIVGPSNFSALYDHMRLTVARSPLFVFAADDVDSVCAVHILTEIFRADSVNLMLRIVSSYEDLLLAAEQASQALEDSRMAVFVNCGGTIDILEHLSVGGRSLRHLQLVILDSHSWRGWSRMNALRRPYHLSNVYNPVTREEEGGVFLMHDREHEEEEAELPGLEEALLGEEAEARSNDDDDEEEEEEEGEKKEKNQKKQAAGEEAERARERRRKRRRLNRAGLGGATLARYYARAWRGRPAALVAYKFAKRLDRLDANALWAAAVAVAEAHHASRLPTGEYLRLMDRLRRHAEARGFAAASATEPGDPLLHEDAAADAPSLPQDGRIWHEAREPRLLLWRHASVEASLSLSRYVATRLRLWSEPGRAALAALLARAGLPTEQWRERWACLRLAARASLRQRLPALASQPPFSLPDLELPSLVRQVSARLQLSAQDHAHALAALLHEARRPAQASAPATALARASAASARATAAAAPDEATEGAGGRGGVWAALDTLSWRAGAARWVERGIESALWLEACLQRLVAQVKERTAILSLPRFRCLYLSELEQADAEAAAEPVALAGLAAFLYEMCREQDREQRRPTKPFLLLALEPPAAQTYLALAFSGLEGSSDVSAAAAPATPTSSPSAHPFALAFRQVALRERIPIEHHFDHALIRLPRFEARYFVERLHDLLDELATNLTLSHDISQPPILSTS